MSPNDICRMKSVYLYTRFERFWHWLQAALIMALLFTGFEIHGSYTVLGYQTAFTWHNHLAWTWLILYAFVLFWMATTGEWKQYIPTTKRLFDVARYYGYGIFKGDPHPVPKTERAKHNPLQRLTYLGIAVVLIPAQMTTGLLYFYYNEWPGWGFSEFQNLNLIATLHTAIAYALVTFLVVHIYMTTTGHSLTAHIRAMCTGWDEVPES